VTTPLPTSGFDPTKFSTTIRPQDDLYQYVNGRWIEETPMPEDKARYGTFDVLNDMSEEAIREILEESRTAPEGSEARKVGDLYSSSTKKPSTPAAHDHSSTDSRRSSRSPRSMNCWR